VAHHFMVLFMGVRFSQVLMMDLGDQSPSGHMPMMNIMVPLLVLFSYGLFSVRVVI